MRAGRERERGAGSQFDFRRRHRRRRRVRAWRLRPRSSRRWAKARPSPSSIRGAPAGPSASPLRTVAIADGPRRLLDHIGAWAAIERRRNRSCRWRSWTASVRDAVRLPHLNFAAKDQRARSHGLQRRCRRRALGALRPARGSAHHGVRCALGFGQACRRARAIRRARVARAPRGRRRRRALETRSPRRYPDRRLGL